MFNKQDISGEVMLNFIQECSKRFQNAKIHSFGCRRQVVILYERECSGVAFLWCSCWVGCYNYVCALINILTTLAACCRFTLRLQPTSERAVQAEWLLGNVSGFTQPGLLNMRWRKRLCLRFRGPTWEMWSCC